MHKIVQHNGKFRIVRIGDNKMSIDEFHTNKSAKHRLKKAVPIKFVEEVHCE